MSVYVCINVCICLIISVFKILLKSYTKKIIYLEVSTLPQKKMVYQFKNKILVYIIKQCICSQHKLMYFYLMYLYLIMTKNLV